LLQQLKWESNFFQLECAELLPSRIPINNRNFERYEWVQGKCFIQENKQIKFFENNGFHFEDLRITFQKKISKPLQKHKKNKIDVVEATKKESKEIEEIAKVLFVDRSRFVSLVGKTKTSEFYAEWVKNAIIGSFDDVCYFLRINNDIAGFATVKYVDKKSARIGLLRVVG
jgi:dTDP-4-amino-4,6-dideoxy-D-galactose acyltransferase